MKRALTLVAVALCLSVLNAFGDSTPPPDPIIDIEPGSGTVGFNGSFTFTVNTTNNPNCTPTDSTGIVLCGNVNPQTQQHFFFQTPTLGNLTGQNITSLTFTFSTAQTGFSAATPADSSPPHQPLFTTVTQNLPFSATYTGSTILSNCSDTGDGVFCAPGDPKNPNNTYSEFQVGFASFFAPANGVETITVSSPEPTTVTLLLGGVGIFVLGRKRLSVRN